MKYLTFLLSVVLVICWIKIFWSWLKIWLTTMSLYERNESFRLESGSAFVNRMLEKTNFALIEVLLHGFLQAPVRLRHIIKHRGKLTREGVLLVLLFFLYCTFVALGTWKPFWLTFCCITKISFDLCHVWLRVHKPSIMKHCYVVMAK